jgi:acyl-coenzyme A synthetase/AMP-(fatty) acid ligase
LSPICDSISHRHAFFSVSTALQVSGHRIGTAEVESALVSHPQCAEAAVVPVDHAIKGHAIYAFVTLMEVCPWSHFGEDMEMISKLFSLHRAA